jgi:hypothetical protein
MKNDECQHVVNYVYNYLCSQSNDCKIENILDGNDICRDFELSSGAITSIHTFWLIYLTANPQIQR